MRSAALRPITPDEVEKFWTDGVVVLYDILDLDWLTKLEPAIEELSQSPAMADMSALADALAPSPLVATKPSANRGTFRSGVDHWRSSEVFRDFACNSPLPSIVGTLLRATKINLWEDSVLIKEPGTLERTHWHQDLGYFHVEGSQVCTSWCPLDAVDGASGAMNFVKGSHRGDLYQPNMFVTPLGIPGTNGSPVPDIDALALRSDVDIITFNLGPGDVSIHHARTLHSAGANLTHDRRRRAISVRYCGDDARYFLRAGAPQKAHHAHVHNGDLLDSQDCPVVWTRNQDPGPGFADLLTL